MATDEERLVADQERQQRVQAQTAAAAKQAAEGEATSSPGGAVVKLSPTARALRLAWLFYLPSFTLTSIYIVLHMLLRYVFQFKSFCRADQGAPMAEAAGAAKSIGLASGSGGGMMEKAWIALGIMSIAPLAAVVGIVLVIGDVVNNPTRYVLCTPGGLVAIVANFSVGAGTDSYLSCVLAGEFK